MPWCGIASGAPAAEWIANQFNHRRRRRQDRRGGPSLCWTTVSDGLTEAGHLQPVPYSALRGSAALRVPAGLWQIADMASPTPLPHRSSFAAMVVNRPPAGPHPRPTCTRRRRWP
jgi:hypothetical protein